MSCKDCVFRSVYQDMGASCDVCSWQTDLANAIKACESSDTCRHRLTLGEAKKIVMEREGGLPVTPPKKTETRPRSEPETIEEATEKIRESVRGMSEAISEAVNALQSMAKLF